MLTYPRSTAGLLGCIFLLIGVSAVAAAPRLPGVSIGQAKPTTVQVGAAEHAANPALSSSQRTVCQGNWQGSVSTPVPEWVTGMEGYFSYQDPSQTGCTDTYPFGVVSVIFPIYVEQPTEIRMYPAVLHPDVDSVSCPFPGLVACIGVDTVFQLTDTGFQTLEIFLPDTCCVPGPYFAVIVIDTPIGTGFIDIVVDSGVAPLTCASYNDYGHGPQDLVTSSGFTNNLKLWTKGTNSTQSQCFCCTGDRGNVDCDTGGNRDISDLTRLIDNLFISFAPLCCEQAANCDGQGSVDISDLTALIDFLYVNFTPLPPC